MGFSTKFEPLVEIFEEPIDSDEEMVLLDDPYCDECDLIFDTILEKEEHEKLQHNTNHEDDDIQIVDDNIQNKDLHYCQVCDVVNVSEEHIRTHQNETEEPKVTLYICDICDSQFDQEDNLKEHVSDIHNNKVDEKYSPRRKENNELIYQIGTHFMAFEEDESMEVSQHQDDIKTSSSSPEDVHKGQRKRVHKGNHYGSLCHICNQKFAHNASLKRHNETFHDGESRYHCKICQNNFLRLEAMNYHVVKEHLGHTCYICSKPYSSNTALAHHVSTIHSDTQSHKCEFCEETFGQFMDMRYHIMNNHNLSNHITQDQNQIKYPCNYVTPCEKVFIREDLRKSHVEIFHQGYRWCQLCNKKLSLSHDMKKHIANVHQNRYDCSMCKKDFSSQIWLNYHVEKDHLGYKCCICSMALSSIEALDRHISSIHFDVKSHKCEFCDETFDKFINMRNHIMKNHNLSNRIINDQNQIKYPCNYATPCEKVFVREDLRRSHVEIFHQGYRWCELCSKKFSLNYDMRKHKENVHEGRYDCRMCNKDFSSQILLNYHLEKDHLGYKCYICSMAMSSVKALDRHISSIHFDVKSHKCEFCEESFEQYIHCRQHTMTSHNLLDKNDVSSEKIIYECDKCSKTFVRLETLNHHAVKEHLGNKCYICSMSLSNITAIDRHISSIHFDVKTHKCEFCEESFGQFLDMRHHIMNNHNLLEHTTEDQNQIKYPCNYVTPCEKVFIREDLRRSHVEIFHQGYRSCELCGDKKFSLNYDMRKHKETVHEGIKAYKCHICHRDFAQDSGLRRHIEDLHNSERYDCNICQKDFPSLHNLNCHVEKDHLGFKCYVCNIQLNGITTVHRHISRIHPEIKLHTCEFCNETFDEYIHMRHHTMSDHSLLDKNDIPSEKISYLCTKCDKSFVRLEALNYHVVKEHLGHTCYICNKPYSSFAAVAVHISTVHSDAQSHKCEFCEESFGQFLDMRHHIMNNHNLLEHTTEDQNQIKYPCNYVTPCEKVFIREDLQKSHVEIFHQGYRWCELCNKKLSLSHDMKRHKANVHENRYDCSMCKKDFSSQIWLNYHVEKDHLGYKCCICSMALSSIEALDRHISSIHFDVKSHKCEFCDETFGQFINMRNHIMSNHNLSNRITKDQNQIKYPCNYVPPCEKVFVREDLRKSHVEIFHQGYKSCELCGDKKFSLNYDMKKHKETVHEGIKAYKCHICHRDFAQDSGLRRHIEDLHNSERYACSLCKKDFSSQIWLNCHVEKDHLGFRCYICNKQYNSVSNVANHVSTSHEMKHHKCEFCEETFLHYTDWRQHILNNHNLLDKQDLSSEKVIYECDKCGKTFLRLEALNLHVVKEYIGHKCYLCGIDLNSVTSVARHVSTIHSDIKSHPCEFCHESFEQYMAMRKHTMINHSLQDNKNDIPPEKTKYSCTACGKEFIREELLKSHIEIHHLGYRLCPYCNKQFSLNYDIKKHIENVHSSTRFECNYCDENFPSLFWFNCHLEKVHMGYKCYLCDKELNSSTGLIRHVNNVHSDVLSHKCTFCDKEFGPYYDLRRHTIAEHKLDSFADDAENDGQFNYETDSSEIVEVDVKFEPEIELKVENESDGQDELDENLEDQPKLEYPKNMPKKLVEPEPKYGTSSSVVEPMDDDDDSNSSTEFGKEKRQKNTTNTSSSKPKCNRCGKSFLRRNVLYAHIEKCAKLEPKSVPTLVEPEPKNGNNSSCEVEPMDEVVSTSSTEFGKEQMQKHITNTSSSKPKCNRCGKSFSRRNILYAHIEKDHEGIQCYICKKIFSQKNNLIRHVETFHKDIGSHKCEEVFDHNCEKAFELYSDLRKHILNEHIMLESSTNNSENQITKNSSNAVSIETSENNTSSEAEDNPIIPISHSPEMVRGIFQKLTHFLVEQQQLPK